MPLPYLIYLFKMGDVVLTDRDVHTPIQIPPGAKPGDVTKGCLWAQPGWESTGLALARTDPAQDQAGLAIWVLW